MTRAEMAEKLSKRLKVTKKQADEIVLSFVGAIKKGIRVDGRVCIQGLGSFTARESRERMGHKPITGEVIHISAKKKIRFTESKFLKRMLNNGVDQEKRPHDGHQLQA